MAFCLPNAILDTFLVVRTVIVGYATEFLHADIVVAVLVFGAAGIALAGRLTEAVDAELVPDAVSRAAAECYKNRKFRKMTV